MLAVALVTATATHTAAQTPVPEPKQVLDLGPMYDLWRVFDSPSGKYSLADRSGSTVIVRPDGSEIAKIDVATNLSVSARTDRITFMRSADPVENVTNHGSKFVWTARIDTLTGRLIGEPRRASIRPAVYAEMSPDGQTIEYARNDSGSWAIYTIPAAGGDEHLVVRRPGRTFAPAWSRDGRWIYYEHEVPNGVARIERVPSAGGEPDSVTTPGVFLGFSKDGKYFAVAGRRPDVRIYRATGEFLIAVKLGGARPSWSSASPHSLISGVNDAPSSLRSISFPEGTVADLPKASDHDETPRFTPDGNHLVFTSLVNGKKQFAISDRNGSNRRLLPTRLAPDVGFQISPDSRYVGFIGKGTDPSVPGGATDSLRLLDIGSGSERTLGGLPNIGAARWRADSKAVLFITFSSPAHRLVRQRTLDGRDSLIRDVGNYAVGRPIYFFGDTLIGYANKEGLHSMSLRSGVTRTIITGRASAGSIGASPAISPDGKWLGLEIDDSVSGAATAYMTTLDGSEKHALGQPLPCGSSVLNWHPNGRDVFLYGYVQCDTVENMNVYSASRDGGPMRNLTARERPGTVEDVTVHPDGKQIVYSVDGINHGIIKTLDLSKTLP
jgi:Tol biopolymer transport system component